MISWCQRLLAIGQGRSCCSGLLSTRWEHLRRLVAGFAWWNEALGQQHVRPAGSTLSTPGWLTAANSRPEPEVTRLCPFPGPGDRGQPSSTRWIDTTGTLTTAEDGDPAACRCPEAGPAAWGRGVSTRSSEADQRTGHPRSGKSTAKK